MGNAVIIGILILLCFAALRSSVQHFKGQGGCCGGSRVPKQRKVITNTLYKKEIFIEGMHCENCKNSVEKSINSIEGACARVNLEEKKAVVEMEKSIDDDLLIRAVEKAGFTVEKILPL